MASSQTLIGALTTEFRYPATCTLLSANIDSRSSPPVTTIGQWYESNPVWNFPGDGIKNCFPSGVLPGSYNYMSPAVCPSKWLSVSDRFRPVVTDTAAVCCPPGYTYTTYSSSYHQCYTYVPSTSSTSAVVAITTGGLNSVTVLITTSTAFHVQPTNAYIKADPLYIRYRVEDFPNSVFPTTTTLTITRPTIAPTITPTIPAPSPSIKKTIIGIVLGVVLGLLGAGLACAVCGIWFYRRNKASKNRDLDYTTETPSVLLQHRFTGNAYEGVGQRRVMLPSPPGVVVRSNMDPPPRQGVVVTDQRGLVALAGQPIRADRERELRNERSSISPSSVSAISQPEPLGHERQRSDTSVIMDIIAENHRAAEGKGDGSDDEENEPVEKVGKPEKKERKERKIFGMRYRSSAPTPAPPLIVPVPTVNPAAKPVELEVVPEMKKVALQSETKTPDEVSEDNIYNDEDEIAQVPKTTEDTRRVEEREKSEDIPEKKD